MFSHILAKINFNPLIPHIRVFSPFSNFNLRAENGKGSTTQIRRTDQMAKRRNGQAAN